jgi:Salmonella virulence plasmid 65kDa B protein
MEPEPNNGADNDSQRTAFTAPVISLPKGGCALKGIGEKFAANPVTGTGGLTVPVYASAGRSGFGPQLALSYDSGSANTAFGFGWNLSLPSITRKTDEGLPQYRDAEESDTFILSGAEDLMPVLLHTEGAWVRDAARTRTVYGQTYAVHRYRPGVEGLFARIERWANVADPRDTFWRSISRDNVTTWYGKTAESRIADPNDPSRVFSWLICETYDDKGNLVVYRYKPEDSVGVDLSWVHERNRTDVSRSPHRYIKDVLYGNRTPYFPDLTAAEPVPQPIDWCFQLVFDYGEHDLGVPLPQDTAASWSCRLDPFSTYRSCFEVRTYRLCRRVLMFHHFPQDPNVGLDCLVRSTDLQHASTASPDPTQPFYSYLLSATQTGYARQGAGYLARSLPPLEFEYSLSLPDMRSFDYSTITEVVLDVRYTARDGGQALADAAGKYLKTLPPGASTADPPPTLAVLLNLCHDFPNEWYTFTTGVNTASLTMDRQRAHQRRVRDHRLHRQAAGPMKTPARFRRLYAVIKSAPGEQDCARRHHQRYATGDDRLPQRYTAATQTTAGGGDSTAIETRAHGSTTPPGTDSAVGHSNPVSTHPWISVPSGAMRGVGVCLLGHEARQ